MTEVNFWKISLLCCLGWVFLVGKMPRAEAYSYGPACQWIRLHGEIELPKRNEVQFPLELTVTYQFPGMKNPATLLTNYPLNKPQFNFYLAGFKEKIRGVYFVPPMFFFAKEIVFRYYAKSGDGRWKSDFHKSEYIPQNIPPISVPANQGRSYNCRTAINLDPLVLK